jgi:uncharacterized membrane protein HdeD (DUF308 family)
MPSLRAFKSILYFESLLLMLLGAAAMAAPQYFTLGVELFIGFLLMTAGVVQIIRFFQSFGSAGYWSTGFSALLNLTVGILLLFYPLAGIISITYVLIAYFLLDGLSKLYLSFKFKPYVHWVWILLSGILSMALAALIFSGLPGTTIWVIGLLLGINLIFYGAGLFALAWNLEKI